MWTKRKQYLLIHNKYISSNELDKVLVLPNFKKYKIVAIMLLVASLSFIPISLISGYIFSNKITSFNGSNDKHIFFNGRDTTQLNYNFIKELKTISSDFNISYCNSTPRLIKLIYNKTELEVYVCVNNYNTTSISPVGNKFIRLVVNSSFKY